MREISVMMIQNLVDKLDGGYLSSFTNGVSDLGFVLWRV